MLLYTCAFNIHLLFNLELAVCVCLCASVWLDEARTHIHTSTQYVNQSLLLQVNITVGANKSIVQMCVFICARSV